MTIGLIPGTFDPPTLGHLDIIERAADMCKQLYVGVAINTNKPHVCFSPKERVDFLKGLLKRKKSIEVVLIEGLVIDFARKKGVDVLIRGLRAFSDMQHEFQMALANKKIGGIETIFLMADGKFSHISSSLIREIGHTGHSLKDFVPAAIESKVLERLKM